MTSLDQSWLQDREANFVDTMRRRYEAEGFRVIVQPRPNQLPDFLASYTPDLIAQKPGKNIAIEVKTYQGAASDRTLVDIRKLFEGHPDWRFDVAIMGVDPLDMVSIPAQPAETVRSGMQEVATLNAQGHSRPALLMAWSLLEAATRVVAREPTNRPRSAGQVVQWLATNGHIEPETEAKLRRLVDLRNRITHGELTAPIAHEDVNQVLAAVDEALRTETDVVQASN